VAQLVPGQMERGKSQIQGMTKVAATTRQEKVQAAPGNKIAMKRTSNEGAPQRGLQRTNSQLVDNGILNLVSSDALLNDSFPHLPSVYEVPPMEVMRSRMQSFDNGAVPNAIYHGGGNVSVEEQLNMVSDRSSVPRQSRFSPSKYHPQEDAHVTRVPS
jgi:hypothetical protein